MFKAYNGHKLFVRSADGQNEEWLTCINPDTFSKDSQISETFSISFTAVLNDDCKVSFDLLRNDAVIVFDGQNYVIKQCVAKYVDDVVTKDVTATHEIFGIQDFRQIKVNKGSNSYTADAMLSFIFGSEYNESYSYQLIGDFPTVDITDWGKCSGLDAVQKAVDSYGAKWLPNGKTVMIYDKNSYKHANNKQYIWSHNTNDIELSVDTTGIVNAAMLYGATKDDNHVITDGAQTMVDSAGISMDTAPTGSAIGTVQSMSGVPVYSSPTKKITTGQVLPNGSKWKVDKSVSIDGTTWYRVATNGWVNSSDITFDKDGDVKPENHVITPSFGQGTIKPSDNSDSSSKTDLNNVVVSTGHAVGNVSTMGTAPIVSDNLSSTGRQLDNGTQWVISNKKTVDDTIYYQVGTNEWVAEKYITFDKDGDVKPEDHTVGVVTGQGTIKSDDPVAIYDSPFYPQTKTGKTLTNGTQWQIGATVSDGANGKSYYEIAPNQWVEQDSFDFSGKTDVATAEVVNQVYGAKIYSSPWSGSQKVLNRLLSTGSQWKIAATVTDGANGKTYYEIAPDEWVCADDVNFDGDTDVEPSEDQGKTGDNEDDDDVEYYFTPFFYYNQESRSKYGLKTGEDITNDQIKDATAMQKYADSVMQTEPVVELTVNVSYQDDKMSIGDTSFLNAEPLGIKTMITLNGVSGNPLTNETPMTITLDNSSLSKTNINYEMSNRLRLANRNLKLQNYQIKKINTKLNKLLSN